VRIRFLLLAACLLIPLSLFAQTAREAVTIEVVDVPVFVTRGAQPVDGLTRDDFELYVNGKAQPIEYFDVVTSSERADESAAPRSLRERRLFLLMFDVVFSDPHAITRAQRAAAELVARAPAGDLFAIATYSSRRGVWFSTPFTADRIALARGITSLTASASGDPLSIVLTRNEREMLGEWTARASERGDFFFARDPVISRLTGDALRDAWSMPFQRTMENQIFDFTDLADRLATLQGQKHVILLSEGFDPAPRTSAGNVKKVSFSVNDETGIQQTSSLDVNNGSLFNAVDEMHRAFQGSDVLLHTLDLRGVSTLFGGDSLHLYASGTGGKFVHNRNAFGNALVALSNALDRGYVLGFKPAGAKRGYNKIVVKLKGAARGTNVHYRKGFSGTARTPDVNDGLYLADVVLNDVPQTGTAAVLGLGNGKLDVKVPLRPLSAQLGKEGKAELLVYVFDASGEAIDFHRQVIDVPADATGETAIQIDVPSQAATAKALLKVDGSLGFSRTDL
jgi:VWFA-related protein